VTRLRKVMLDELQRHNFSELTRLLDCSPAALALSSALKAFCRHLQSRSDRKMYEEHRQVGRHFANRFWVHEASNNSGQRSVFTWSRLLKRYQIFQSDESPPQVSRITLLKVRPAWEPGGARSLGESILLVPMPARLA
jgi:hypothetical protein